MSRIRKSPYIKIPKKADASHKRIASLVSKANQYKCWANMSCTTNATATAHFKKYKQAVKELQSLGYTEDI